MTDREARFATFGPEVAPEDVPALVALGSDVWAFGYGDDDDFTVLDRDDVERAGDAATLAAWWGPFRVSLATLPRHTLFER